MKLRKLLLTIFMFAVLTGCKDEIQEPLAIEEQIDIYERYQYLDVVYEKDGKDFYMLSVSKVEPSIIPDKYLIDSYAELSRKETVTEIVKYEVYVQDIHT